MLKSIIFILSGVNTGDISHHDAVKEAIERLHPQPALTYSTVEANLPKDKFLAKFEDISKQVELSNTLCLAIGEKGLNTLKYLKPYKEKLMIGLSIHQYFGELKDLIGAGLLDFIALPESTLKTLSPEDKGVLTSINHFFTLGIPTKNPSLKELKKAYEDWPLKGDFPVHNKYIIVMTPGDAPDSTGKVNLFTSQSAQILSDALQRFWRDQGQQHTILIQNSPRTGKFDDQGAIICAHEYKKGENPQNALDDISRNFIKNLEEKGIPFHFFNFAFEINGDSKKAQSVYNPLLYLAQSREENYFVVPGESVSMVSQLPIYLKTNQLLLFAPSSMNESHKGVNDQAFESGYCCWLEQDGTVRYPSHESQAYKTDAQGVAEALLQSYKTRKVQS